MNLCCKRTKKNRPCNRLRWLQERKGMHRHSNCDELGAIRSYARAPAISRHSAAHFLHAVAHSWQWSISCCPHSFAHASQTSASNSQAFALTCESRLISATVDQQSVAQSRSVRMQSAIFLTSFSLRHASAQCSQAWAQSRQASIQLEKRWLLIVTLHSGGVVQTTQSCAPQRGCV